MLDPMDQLNIGSVLELWTNWYPLVGADPGYIVNFGSLELKYLDMLPATVVAQLLAWFSEIIRPFLKLQDV